LKQSVLCAIETDQSKTDPEYYYNMSCVHAIFGEFEASEMYFNQCFSSCDAKFSWDETHLLRLYRDSRVDQDYARVRHFAWFSRQDYEEKLKEEII